MLGLPFLGLKRVAGAVVGQADVSRRVSGRGMGLQSRKAVAPRFASVLQSASKLIFASAAPAVSRRVVKLLQG